MAEAPATAAGDGGLLSSLAADKTVLKLPHPYLTEYTVVKAASGVEINSKTASSALYQLCEKAGSSRVPLPTQLVNQGIFFSGPANLKSSELPPASDNSPWARARRSPSWTVAWKDAVPLVAHIWLLVYVLCTLEPDAESLRLELHGPGAAALGKELKDVALAIEHPSREHETTQADETSATQSQVIALRSTFWQGAGCPFGPRSIWCPEGSAAAALYPPAPLHHVVTISSAGDPQCPERRKQSWHPVRAGKPAPGSVIYSRWIRHLGETFSMVALDCDNAEHLQLFHQWQNDPRVSQGWNETGTLEQHRQYLRNIEADAHQMAVLARWDDNLFAYFEVYWAKEDLLGSYYDAGDFDRGRHSLVGDVRFRGRHRVSAWWSSLMHYLFLDDTRTMAVVGEPRDSNSTVVMYDLIHGFGLEGFVDLPHKRSALVRCSRSRFFQLCPLGDNEKAVGGMRIGLVAKL
ncbi:hypothetical protein CDD81_2531 [Ophiocordyceps australis]|uniref:Acyltransferase MbtK/IucB-like conserved domain-containing protein n=1 Tax=Ophiocordyceps australis TaxID=1399860 RepID=A0A2C5Y9P2_9HYPO|nr:hypothetical protein CDD81_2531 [Ophiocordyceps australis]